MNRFALALCALSLAACSQDSDPAKTEPAAIASISGTVSYRERIALSPEAELTVSLLDVSKQDVKATEIAARVVTNPGQVPIEFELEYDPSLIDDRMTYSISAQISEGGKVRFRNDTRIPVLTRGAGNEVDIVLVGLRRPGLGGPAAAARAQKQAAAKKKPAGMELEGMFRYMADAALFRDCSNNKSYPVSMEESYKELESMYLNSGIEAGSEIGVKLRGRYLERPAMEGNTNKVKLIVDKVYKLLPEKECTAQAHADLIGTYWKLLELNGRKITTADGAKEAHMILAAGESRAHGNAGCNNFFAAFETEGDKLKFSAAGSTMMACPHGMDTETAFLGMLDQVTRFSINGLIMELYQEENLLARLEAVYL